MNRQQYAKLSQKSKGDEILQTSAKRKEGLAYEDDVMDEWGLDWRERAATTAATIEPYNKS